MKHTDKYIVAVSNNLYGPLLGKLKAKYGPRISIIKKPADLTFERLNKIKPRAIFFVHWSHIIKPEIYENFECIIFHMTDVPFGRGGSPLQNLIARGIYKTKLTALKCVKELDAGPVYMKLPVSLKNKSARELFSELSLKTTGKMIEKMIAKMPVPRPQKGKVVVFKRRTPQQSDIGALTSITKVFDYIRMLDADGYPRAFIDNGDIRFEFSSVKKTKAGLEAKVFIRGKK